MQREDWDRRYSDVDLLWSRDPNRFLVAEAEDLAPGRALDLACGEGETRLARGGRLAGHRRGLFRGRDRQGARTAASARLDIEFTGRPPEYKPKPNAFDLVACSTSRYRWTSGNVSWPLRPPPAPGGILLLVGRPDEHDERGGWPERRIGAVHTADIVEDPAGSRSKAKRVFEMSQAQIVPRSMPSSERVDQCSLTLVSRDRA
jgi:hypothetical protein